VFGAGMAIFDTLAYGGPLRSGYRPGEITFSVSAFGPNLRYMPAHLIQAIPVLVLGLGALAGIAVTWLRDRLAGGQRAAAAGRDLAVALALAACWAAVWGVVRHLYLDRGARPEHAAGSSFLRAGPGRHLAGRLAAGPRPAQAAPSRRCPKAGRPFRSPSTWQGGRRQVRIPY